MSLGSGEVFGRDAGQLKVFIGAAPGVGKTFTMLREAVSLRERGVDVVIGYTDSHGRLETEEQMDGLEVVPARVIHYHNRTFEEVNVEAIIQRNPDVVVIDELAHSNAPGSTFPKRFMDVEYLLDYGISVLTAVNIQHIEGIHEEAEEITGIRVRETIPYEFLKRADEVSVIDVTPETLRQRLRDGSIYPSDKVEQALQNFFRKSNLAGLRELALRAVAEDVDDRLERSYSRRKIRGPVGVREVILVCVSHYPRAVKLIRRGQRMALRLRAELYVLFIIPSNFQDLSEKDRQTFYRLKELANDCDAEFITESRDDRKVGQVILETAERVNATQVVLGQPAPNQKWRHVLRESPLRFLLRNLRYTDLRIVGWRDLPQFSIKPSPTQFQGARMGNRKLTGRLTIYVGSAPGVGKTYKMLQDANDWKKRGWDVVVGLIDTHGREETAEQIKDLEVIPMKTVVFEGRTYQELDVDAIVRRRPWTVLIDELAHTNVPGSMREKRYQDIEYILAQGIHVVTAVNIQHLESLHDKVEHITGVKVRERIPDWFVKVAREIKLIDITPEELQQRLEEGKIYSQEKVEYALENFFQTAHLAALRELALLEVADDVDRRNEKAHAGKSEEAQRDKILVCVNRRPHSEKLIRRGWRLADRLDAELWVLVVLTNDDGSSRNEGDLKRIESLSQQFEAHFITKQASVKNVGQTIVKTAEELGVSQLVAGQPMPPHNLMGRIKPNPLDDVLAHAEFVDLHIVAYERDG